MAIGPDVSPSGPTFEAALAKYRSLMAMESNIGTDNYLVSACLNQYRKQLASSRKTRAPGNLDSMARGFCDRFGSKKVSALIADDVQDWLGEQSTGPHPLPHVGVNALAIESRARGENAKDGL